MAKKIARKKVGAVQSVAAPVVMNSLPATTGGVRVSPSISYQRSKTIERLAVSRDRVAISRYLQEALPFAYYVTNTLPEEAVGRGIGIKSVSTNPEFKKAATAYFAKWANSPAVDLRKKLDFYALQPLLLSTILGDGEFFTQKVQAEGDVPRSWQLSDTSRRRLQLQLFTRDQVVSGDAKAGPGERWVDGLLLNAFDQTITARVQLEPRDGRAQFADIPAGLMFHGMKVNRINQVHGIPWLLDGKDLLDTIDIQAIRKHAAKVKAAFLGATVTDDGNIPEALAHVMSKGTSGTPAVDNGQRYAEIFGGAVMIPLARGQSVNWFNQQEAMNYGQLIEELISPFVYRFGYPPEYIFKLGALGGTANRTVLAKVSRAHQRLRSLLHPFLQWVWEWVISDAVLNGELSAFAAVADWNEVDFVADPDPSVDSGRDEKAEMARLENNASTMEEYTERRTGGSGVAVRRERITEKLEDMQFAIETAKALGLPASLAMLRAIPPNEMMAMAGLSNSLGLDPVELAAQIAAVGMD
jgi:hypothetical protein